MGAKMRQVVVNSRWSDSQHKDRRVKVRSIETENNVTFVYYGLHAADTTYVCEINEFLRRFKPIGASEQIN